MNRKETGTYHISVAGGENVKAFIPAPLPPLPSLEMDAVLINALADASLAIGRLNSLRLAPDYNLFLYQYVRKEAVLSSRIEGTQSTLTDLLAHADEDIPGVPYEDVLEVSNYVAAMEYGKRRMVEDGFPLSSRLLREIHSVLLSSGRGSDKASGEFKRTQNWLGGTRPGNALFVPAPPMKPSAAWANWNTSFMMRKRGFMRCSRPDWLMFSLRRSIHFLTETDVLVGCSFL